MHYYIDGYNLLFRFLSPDDNLSSQRQILIEELNKKAELLNLDITIVFDAHHQPGELQRAHFRRIEIMFSDERETADDRILLEIKESRHPAQITVVTSDKKLAWFARRCSSATESVEHFMGWLNKRVRNKARVKEPPPPPKKIAPKPEPRPVKKSAKPLKTDTPEQCSDYYLDAFQSRLAKLESTEKPRLPKEYETPSQRRKLRKEKAPPPSKEEQSLLDMERWLRAFSRE